MSGTSKRKKLTQIGLMLSYNIGICVICRLGTVFSVSVYLLFWSHTVYHSFYRVIQHLYKLIS